MPTSPRKLFVNLAVDDLQKSVAFWRAIGFDFDQRLTDENGTCMIVNEDAYVMLLVRDFFAQFTSKQIVNTATHVETTLCLSADSRAGVDELVDKALAAGGAPSDFHADEGFMYGSSFRDVDGHQWEVVYMDPSALEG